MFFLHELEKQVELHPSFFGRNMHELVTGKLLRDVEGTCNGQYFIITVLDTFNVSEGKILPGNGMAQFTVRYRAVCFKPFIGETIDAVVTNVLAAGFQTQAGPLPIFITHELMPDDLKFDPNSTPWQWSDNEDQVIEQGSFVRVKIIGMQTRVNSLYAVGSIKEDFLGVPPT